MKYKSMKKKRKCGDTYICQICKQGKANTTEHWYIDSRPHTNACKNCVEQRIAEQGQEIRRQLNLGIRAKHHWDNPKEITCTETIE